MSFLIMDVGYYLNQQMLYSLVEWVNSVKETSNNLVIDFLLLHHRPCDEIIAMKNKV